MSLGLILLIVLILVLLGAIPTWPHSRSWGFAPSGVIGLLVLVVIVLVLTGRL
jgi:flagellin-like protein